MTSKSLLSIFFFLLSIASFAQRTISVEEFGLKPDTRENATPLVLKALEKCNQELGIILYFPKGRYDFWPHHCQEYDYYESNTTDIMPKRLAILIKQMQDFTLDGGGSEFVFHDRMQPVTVDESSNVCLKSFSIDWDVPLTAQGEVINVGDDYVELRIDVLESPYIIENDKLVFVGEGWKSEISSTMDFGGEPKRVVPNTGDRDMFREGWDDFVYSSDNYGVVRITKKGGFGRKLTVGNVLVLRHNKRDHAGIFICDSEDVSLSNIRVYHTAGLGILAQYTKNVSFNNVWVAPNKAKNRVLSGHDDGFHMMGCSGDIKVDSCRWEGLMDDPMNIHGTSVRIIEIQTENKILCKFMHHQSLGMRWGRVGDKVGFIENESMRTVAYSTIKAINFLDKELFEVELSSSVPEAINVGAALENLSWTPNVDIRNSFFGSCRARGLLISTPGKVVVENNIFESSGSAILVAGDANYWYESGAVTDVLIKANEFRYPCLSSHYQFCHAIISIEPEIPSPDGRYPFHRNIRIEGNSFAPFDYPILYAKSVDSLSFIGNTITRSYDIKPFHDNKYGITLDACRNVVVKGNIVNGDVLGQDILLKNMNKRELMFDKKEFFRLK